MRRKEYAVTLGLATPGKGRMSREALEAIDKARAEGMTFDDDAPVRAPREVRVTVKKDRTGPVAPVVNHTQMADTLYVYPRDAVFKGEDTEGNKVTVNGRQVCRNSGYSIVGCRCGDVHSVLSKHMTIASVRLAK